MTTQEIFAAEQVLTVATAQKLKGELIYTTSPVYKANTPVVNKFVVGEIISEWDDAARNEYPKPNFKNFQEYWASYMSPQQIEEMKTKLILFSENGTRIAVAHTKFYNFYDEPTFTIGDADREVYFLLKLYK